MPEQRQRTSRCRVVVIWIDWYPYHVARFRGLMAEPAFAGKVAGIELVGGVGVHQGLKFREELPADLPVTTLLPQASWATASQTELARRLWGALDRLQPEIVMVPGYYTLPAIAAAVWARVHGRTSVLMTESTAGDHPRSWWKELPKRLALRVLFGWAITGGKAHVAYLRALGFPPDRVVGCYDVVENAMFRDGVRALRAPAAASLDGVGGAGEIEGGAQRSFLYVGRLAEEKNVEGLLRSWTAYRNAGGRWPLVLCGDGPLRPALEEMAARSGWGSEVRFAGLRTARELLPFYAAAGCFVLPSAREPWGLVVNEAMAAELPVLVSDRCGCAPDLVREGENGFQFSPEDTAYLAELLRRMERMSDAERAAMGKRSAGIVLAYSPENFGRSMAQVQAGSRRVSRVADRLEGVTR